jgi:putative DNA primase/helicase
MFRADHGERTVWLILDRLADARQSGDFYEYAKSARGIKAVMAYLQYEDQVYCVAADFDKDDYLLNCLGETYDLRSGKHWASMPVDMHSKTTRYVPAEGTCDLFTNFLKQITLNDRELQAWLLRWAGYCLTGDVKAGYFCNWYGTGGNGKGVLLRVLAAIMGDYAAALSPKAVVLQAGEAEGRFEYTALPGARLAYVDDTPNGRLAEGRKE